MGDVSVGKNARYASVRPRVWVARTHVKGWVWLSMYLEPHIDEGQRRKTQDSGKGV